jgi:hypothetical protein
LKFAFRDLRDYLPRCQFGTAQRSLLTARLFGDENEIAFWTVALHYLRQIKAAPQSQGQSQTVSASHSGDLFIPSTPAKENQELVSFEDENAAASANDDKKNEFAYLKDFPLETCFDVLVDGQTFQV